MEENINIVEAASKLAEDHLEETYYLVPRKQDLWIQGDDMLGEIYSKEGQKEFDKLYDYYFNVIYGCRTKKGRRKTT